MLALQSVLSWQYRAHDILMLAVIACMLWLLLACCSVGSSGERSVNTIHAYLSFAARGGVQSVVFIAALTTAIA
jgi:hypothetical protein